jgi:hypothetical protein
VYPGLTVSASTPTTSKSTKPIFFIFIVASV